MEKTACYPGNTEKKFAKVYKQAIANTLANLETYKATLEEGVHPEQAKRMLAFVHEEKKGLMGPSKNSFTVKMTATHRTASSLKAANTASIGLFCACALAPATRLCACKHARNSRFREQSFLALLGLVHFPFRKAIFRGALIAIDQRPPKNGVQIRLQDH